MRTFAHKQISTQHTKSSNSARSSQAFSAQSRDVQSILHLQRTIGNHAVQRLLQTNGEELHVEASNPASTRFWQDFSRIPVQATAHTSMQPKLKVNIPRDSYEQEADRIADQVMRMSDRPLQHACACGGSCRKCSLEQQSQEQLQTKPRQAQDTRETAVQPIVQEVISSPGQPLDSESRDFFEARLGHNFSQVRVHTDAKAARSARALYARAYTTGHNVVFGARQYVPHSMEGRRLLAHELTHVLQQRGPSRRTNPGQFTTIVQREVAPPSHSHPGHHGGIVVDTFQVTNFPWHNFSGRATQTVLIELRFVPTTPSRFAAGSINWFQTVRTNSRGTTQPSGQIQEFPISPLTEFVDGYHLDRGRDRQTAQFYYPTPTLSFRDTPSRDNLIDRVTTWRAETSCVRITPGRNIRLITYSWGFSIDQTGQGQEIPLTPTSSPSPYHMQKFGQLPQLPAP